MKIPMIVGRDAIFRNALSASKEYAAMAWRRNQMPTPILTGIDEHGEVHTHVIDFNDERGRLAFYSMALEDYKKKGVVIVARMAESWSLKLEKDEAKEYEAFRNNGGSLETWPGSKEVFLSEIMDKDHYAAIHLEIFRDENGEYSEYEETQSLNMAIENEEMKLDGILMDFAAQLWKDSN